MHECAQRLRRIAVRRDEPAGAANPQFRHGCAQEAGLASVAGSGGAEKARRRLWVDTSGIDKGVEVQVTATVADLDYQPGDGFHVEVRHPIPVAERGDYREFGANP